jgi:hypothetical protein
MLGETGRDSSNNLCVAITHDTTGANGQETASRRRARRVGTNDGSACSKGLLPLVEVNNPWEPFNVGGGQTLNARLIHPQHDRVTALVVLNPARPRGRPSLDELMLEEAARVVKFQAGDKIMHMDRDRALMRKLFDMALNGKVPAIQLVIARLAQAQAALSVKADPEAPLTEEEIAILAMMPKMSGS